MTWAWYDSYLSAFSRCGRGQSEVDVLLKFYGEPLILATEEQMRPLTSAPEILAAVKPLLDALIADGYSHSEMIARRAEVLTATAAILTTSFRRVRSDGHAIGTITPRIW